MQRGKVPVHYDEVDVYRGIAALLIVLLHAYQKPGISVDRSTGVGIFVDLLLRNLHLAVDWFFILSGFLLFLPFVRAALEQQGRLSSRDFLHRQMYRIVPAYYLVLLVFWFLGTPKWPNSWSDLLEHLTFTHIFNPAHIFSSVGPAWSLTNEMVYYRLVVIIGPFSCWLCGMLGSLRARVLALSGIVLLLIAVSRSYHAHFLLRAISLDAFHEHFQPLACFITFGFGMLLAIGAVVTAGPKFMACADAPPALRPNPPVADAFAPYLRHGGVDRFPHLL